MRLYPFLSVGLFLLTAQAAEETAVVSEGKINVRGQPSLIGEVITQLEQGEKVTVLERITNSTPRTPGEPTNWAKIKLPPNTPVWVFAPFVKEGAINVSRLNVRAGRGENYSVIGRLNRGEEVKSIRTVEEWMEIEQPTNAYAFVDISLLKFAGEPPATTPQPTTPPIISAAPNTLSNNTETAVAATNLTAESTAQTEPTNNVIVSVAPEPVILEPEVTPAPVLTPEATPPPSTAQTEVAVDSNNRSENVAPPQESSVLSPIIVAALEATNPPSAATAPTELPKVAPQTEEIVRYTKRVVRREGIVRATTSIQAPTWYELVNAETKKRVNYLFGDNLDINLKDYRGKRVVVSGEEAIDQRWPNTPIMALESLDVLPDADR